MLALGQSRPPPSSSPPPQQPKEQLHQQPPQDICLYCQKTIELNSLTINCPACTAIYHYICITSWVTVILPPNCLNCTEDMAWVLDDQLALNAPLPAAELPLTNNNWTWDMILPPDEN
ncbi:hypothetical protein I4U23_016992 [Adineta vaga]|nr:hypothetical protein I4U23_016992 [Adineta vaga]